MVVIVALDASRELRSEEHTSELQSPLIISYAVFCFVLICGTIPLDQPLWLTLVYNVGGVVVFLGLAVMWYNRYINRLRETDPEAAESELRPSVLDMME